MSVFLAPRLVNRDISFRLRRRLSPVGMGMVGRLMNLTAVRSKI